MTIKVERSGVAQVKVFNLSLLALCDTPTERQLDMQFLLPVHHDQCSGLQKLGKKYNTGYSGCTHPPFWTLQPLVVQTHCLSLRSRSTSSWLTALLHRFTQKHVTWYVLFYDGPLSPCSLMCIREGVKKNNDFFSSLLLLRSPATPPSPLSSPADNLYFRSIFWGKLNLW